MPEIPLSRVVAHCDRYLRVAEFQDWDGALNGLQVENSGTVNRLAAAVDARHATIRLAVESGARLLLVHHGLFWGPSHPWTGRKYELIRLLLDNDLAVYSVHLPLDAHPRIGNSVLLAKAIGLKNLAAFFPAKGRDIGFRGETRIARDELVRRLERATGAPPVLLPGGPATCRRIGVVTGGGGGELREAARCGVDTFVTGEGPHWTATLAEELGVNVLYAGHYATETFGVKALAGHLSEKFGLPWQFLDCPTGL